MSQEPTAHSPKPIAHSVVLDVDVGIDDAVMMLYLAAEPGVEIVAIGSCHGNCSAAALLHPSLVRETVERPMYIEPTGDVHHGVGRDPDEAAKLGLPARPPVRIVTKVDQRRFLDRFVDALTTPLGALGPLGDD